MRNWNWGLIAALYFCLVFLVALYYLCIFAPLWVIGVIVAGMAICWAGLIAWCK